MIKLVLLALACALVYGFARGLFGAMLKDLFIKPYLKTNKPPSAEAKEKSI